MLVLQCLPAKQINLEPQIFKYEPFESITITTKTAFILRY